ncbi:hypothetical protein ACTHGU_20585 [Chitinophagaceae bacterium MMS25-I14]
MKKLITAVCLLLLLTQCKKADNPVPNGSSIALFAVRQDGTGYHLLGGKVMPLPTGSTAGNTIPLKSTFVYGGDENSFTLTYLPTGDTVFSGAIIWVGTGAIWYPKLDSPAAFFKAAAPASMPDTNHIQLIHKTSYDESTFPADIKSVWAQLSNLYVVSEYMKRHAKVALMQYPYLPPA